MCGLVAVVTKNGHGLTKEQVDAFDNLLFIDSLRGMDSTGVFVVDKEGNMDWAKEASPSFYYRMDDAYRDITRTAFQRGRALVGHNRAATKGAVTDQNAHPFTVDDRITLCHNGTLWGGWEKLTDEKVDVDSHAIAHVIHQNGDDVEKALQQINGAFALIWHDFKNNTLNFIRNKERPLNFVETNNGWLWASEANMLEWILARYPSFKPVGKVAELTPGCLVTYDFSGGSWKLDHRDIKLEAPKSYQTNYSQGSYFNGSRTRHPYACGYEQDDSYFVDTPAAKNESVKTVEHPITPLITGPVTPSPVGRGVNNRIERAAHTGRTLAQEQELAKAHKMDISALAFGDAQENIATIGGWVTATCIDYNSIKPDSNQYGFFLYARLNSNHNFLVKVFMDATVDDTELLGMCLSTEEIQCRVVSRQWRCYNDAADGQGFAILNADEVREVSGVEK